MAAAEVSREESEHRARSALNIVSYACLQAIYTAPIDSLQPVIIFVDFFFSSMLCLFSLSGRGTIFLSAKVMLKKLECSQLLRGPWLLTPCPQMGLQNHASDI